MSRTDSFLLQAAAMCLLVCAVMAAIAPGDARARPAGRAEAALSKACPDPHDWGCVLGEAAK